MNINLKQPEIEAALRQYIGRKLDLRNSTLAIVFNMGRGDNGLSANLTIEDVLIPGFTDVGPDADDKDTNVSKGCLGTAQLALQAESAGPSDAVKAMAAGSLTPAAIDAGAKVGAASTKIADLISDATTDEVKPVVVVKVEVAEKPADVSVTVTEVVAEAASATIATAAVATAETEAAQATPVAEAKTAEAPAKPTTSLFG